MRTVYHPLTAEQEPAADIFFNYEAFLPNTVTPKHQHVWGQLQLISGGIVGYMLQGNGLSPSQCAIWVPAGIEHESYTRRSIHYCSMNIVAERAAAFSHRDLFVSRNIHCPIDRERSAGTASHCGRHCGG